MLQDEDVIDKFDTTSFTTKALGYGEAQIKRFFDTPTYDQARKVQLEIANYNCLSRKRRVCALVSQVQENIPGDLSAGKAPRPGGEALEARPLQQEVRPTLEVEVPDSGKPGESGRAKLHEMSISLREKEFQSLARKYKLENSVSKLSLSKLRREFMRFPTKAMSATFGSGKMAIITLSLYIKSVHDVFTSHSTALDRAEILTSVIPVVGCATETAAADEHEQADVLDHSLCVLADTLLMTPAWPVGVVLSLGRMMVKDIPNLFAEHLQRMRDEKWREALENARHYVGGKNFTHDGKINLDLEMAAVVYGASEALGNLTAIENMLPESLVSDRDRRNLADEIERKRHEIGIKTCVDMVRRMGKLMEDMPKTLVESLYKEAGKLNDAFIDNYRKSMSSGMFSDFLIIPAASLGFPVPVGSREEVVTRNIQHLRHHPIPADLLKPIEDQARLRLFHILKSQWGLTPCSKTPECKGILKTNDPDRKSDCDFDAVVRPS